jgi:hypothetical protein
MIKRHVALMLFVTCTGFQNISAAAMSRMVNLPGTDSLQCTTRDCAAEQFQSLLFCKGRLISKTDLHYFSQTDLSEFIINLSSALSITYPCCKTMDKFKCMGNKILEAASKLLAIHRDDLDDDVDDLVTKLAPFTLSPAHLERSRREALALAMFGELPSAKSAPAGAPHHKAEPGRPSGRTPKKLRGYTQRNKQFKQPQSRAGR